ncbi:cell separation protein [Fusobacterium nucleatum]|uniref:Cell separation protein n=1 Tax=Fusobacterium nucleatum subsp. polymorphum TaxID=76857 RepID=A0A2C6ASA5_FUSNP|nr:MULTISPECIES: DUF6683 family protein [Fusobacterium]PHH97105.1 cell separation protein [Fusobacterium polymorphum]WDF24046.1 cell separation protein [Fusobacterium nucleatum]
MGKTFKYLFIAIIIGAGLFISQPAKAFYTFDPSMGYQYSPEVMNASGNYLLSSMVIDDIGNGKYSSNKKSTKSTPKKVKKAKITFRSNSDSRGLDYFVNRYPANQREQARTYFKTIQDGFPQVAKSLGIPTNDLSTGMAALVAGAYMAYNNVSLNDDYMKPLQKQFKEAFESVSDYDKMSDSDKKYLYDQMVILGMTLTLTEYENQQNPNSKTTADLRKAGKDILEGMFGVDASNIKITSSGLSI